MSTRPRDNRPADNRPAKAEPPPRPKPAPKNGKTAPVRVCRTVDECFGAGWNDGENDAPMTPEQRGKLIALWRPHRRTHSPRPVLTPSEAATGHQTRKR